MGRRMAVVAVVPSVVVGMAMVVAGVWAMNCCPAAPQGYVLIGLGIFVMVVGPVVIFLLARRTLEQ